MLVCISQHDMPIDTFLKDHFRYKHNHKCASWFVCVLCSSCIPVSHNIIYLLQMYIFMISLFFYFFQISLDFHNQFFMYCLSRDWLAIRAKYPRTSSTIFCCLILSVASGCLRAYVCTGRTSLQVRLQQVLLEGVLVVLSCSWNFSIWYEMNVYCCIKGQYRTQPSASYNIDAIIWGVSLQYGAHHNAPCRLHTFTLNSKCS